MINKILLFCFFLIYNCIYAQFGEAQLIEDVDFQISKVYASDLDGDGDMDVLASGANADTIIWYENLDGLGNFGPKHTITQTLNFTQSLSTADIDGDGDQDVLATSAGNNKVVWYKNLDGLGNFSSEIIINANAPNAKQAIATDVDDDGDEDIVVALREVGKVVWYENIDGLGNFSTENSIAEGLLASLTIFSADIDGDSKIDIISNSSSNNSIVNPSWYKNLDGLGNFSNENIISNDTFGSSVVIAGDVDNDNDNDIFNLEAGGDTIAWYENVDGNGTFSEKQIIAFIFRPSDIKATDIDNDGDIDLFATYVGDGKIAWFENEDGLGTFGERKIIDNFASTSIFGADLDGDGYKDALTKIDLDQFVWYKNLTYLEVADKLEKNISIYPNPVQNTLYITNINNIAINQIEVFNILGKKMLEFTNVINKQINLSKLNIGLYFIHIKTSEGVLVKKVIKE